MLTFIEWVRDAALATLALSTANIFFAMTWYVIIRIFKKIEREHFQKELKLKIGGPNKNRFRNTRYTNK